MTTRLAISKEPKLLQRLVGLLGVGRNNEKITKLAALTLNNLSMAPATREYLKPFEHDLFIIAASDESVSKVLASILMELDQFE